MEGLEWDLGEDNENIDLLEISNQGKTIRNISEYSARIKLKNTNKYTTQKYKVTLKTLGADTQNVLRIKQGPRCNRFSQLEIGLWDKNYKKKIYYRQTYGDVVGIHDYNNLIRELTNKLDITDYLMIEEKCVEKRNNGLHLYSVSIWINEVLLHTTIYAEEQRKQLYLDVGIGVELEVEVAGKIKHEIGGWFYTNCSAYRVIHQSNSIFFRDTSRVK